MDVFLPDGTKLEVEQGATLADVAKTIGSGLYRAALSGEIDGKVADLQDVVPDGAQIKIFTFDNEEGKEALRHTASHIMAQAVKRVFKDRNVIFGIGPAIKDGFYYDIQLDGTISIEDFDAIEKEMQAIVKADYPIERYILPRDRALEWAKNAGEVFKEELILDLPEGEEISFYKQEEFVDLCAGPHLPSTGKLKHFKLLSVAGAYWRGSEKNPMLQRIYGTAFDSKKNLEEYIHRVEEAKKRDHRKLGRELDLFSMSEEGPGFPFFHPRGMIIKNNLLDFWRKVHTEQGYDEITTPIILSADLWKRSGHWDHYQENMYFLKIDEQDYAVKPMNCPGSMLMYKRKQHSYRDLPIKMAELGLVHRHELSGALHGLMRVRSFTQDDAHIFMTPEQIEDEVVGVLNLTESFYDVFGFKYHVELSTRPEDSMGSDEDWQRATDALIAALNRKGWDYILNEGDGAFYGPKIDFHLEDSIGRTWQCGTVQLDFQMPERFELTYDGDDGEKHRPVMVHRVVMGSIERFIGILTEHFAGLFPLWLSPEQVRVMSITDRSQKAVEETTAALKAAGIRAEADIRNEKIGYKIRQAQMEKVPYMLVIGDREAESGEVSVRTFSKGDIGTMSVEKLILLLQEEIKNKEIPALDEK